MPRPAPADARVDALLARTTLDERAALVAGIDLWETPGIPRLGVPGLRLTDGPNGARGPRWTGLGAACFPCGSALGATWDPALVARVGVALGQEARTKGAHVLLAPTVNLHRHPLAGRNFECFGEDPHLSAVLAAAYVRGVQSTGVGTTVKHLVANDSEHERMTISSEVDERTLRELYLVPFEAALGVGGGWAVMAAYNRLGGTYCSEHPWLLGTLLHDEWGFDGVVVSDWFATHSTAAAANAGLGLEMPGPARWFGPRLADAVRAGHVAGETLERMARDMLVLTARTGALDGQGGGDAVAVDDPAHRALARESAAASFVLLRNHGLLPLDPSTLRSVAIVGPGADEAWIMGGGSASLTPHRAVTPLSGLEEALGPRGVEIRHARGPASHRVVPPVEGRRLAGGHAAISYFASLEPGDPPVLEETVTSLRHLWLGAWTDALDPTRYSARISGALVVDEDGAWTLGLTTVGACRVVLRGEVVLDAWETRPPGDSFFGFGSAELTATVPLRAAEPLPFTVEYSSGERAGIGGLTLGLAPPDPPDALDRAVAAARSADVAIVVVGTGPDWETEGRDRDTMDLPRNQAALVRAVAGANPRTIVCVNAGAPVTMDWVDEPAATMQCWLPGQEWGHALADVLVGVSEPGGRLPVTIPRRLEDTPAFASYPGKGGQVEYGEGLLMGYRGYDTRAVEPAFCFGHGSGYTSFDYGSLELDGRRARVEVTNRGARAGAEVVQCYVHDPEASVSRPEQELRAFTKVRLDPGETQTVTFELDDRALAFWGDGWVVEPGTFEVRVGRSSRDIRSRATITIPERAAGPLTVRE